MKSSIKLKHGKELEELIKDPIKLAIIVQIAFNMDEETGEAKISFPKRWEAKVGDLVMVGLIEHKNGKIYKIINKKIVDITLKKKPSKSQIGEQKLSSKDIIVPKELETYYQIAISFRALFYENLKSIGGRVNNLDNARFGKWVNPIKLMIEKDNITTEQLREVWQFLKIDTFWKDKVQSTAKLREKFNTLYNQLKANGKRFNTKGNGGRANSGNGKVSTSYVGRVFDDLRGK